MAGVPASLRSGVEPGGISVGALETARVAELLPAELWTIEHSCSPRSAADAPPAHSSLRLLGAGGTFLCNYIMRTSVDAASLAPSGPTAFHGMAVLHGLPDTAIAVFAFTLGVDGAANFFIFVAPRSGGYEVTATLTGTQAQVRFASDSRRPFQFWSADASSDPDPDKQCQWCRKYYTTTTFAWNEGRLRQLRSLRSRRGYSPSSFFEAPFRFSK